jgi:hypothetical protein
MRFSRFTYRLDAAFIGQKGEARGSGARLWCFAHVLFQSPSMCVTPD